MGKSEEQLREVGKDIDQLRETTILQQQAIGNLQTELTTLKNRVDHYHPDGSGRLPFDGELIGKYCGADEVALMPEWPARFNQLIAGWNQDRKQQNLRVVCPSGARFVIQWTHRAPTMLGDGKLSWQHSGTEYDHSQVMLEIPDERMAQIKYYLKPDFAYGYTCECSFEKFPSTWISLRQFYGRVHPDLGGDGQKDVTAHIIDKEGQIYCNVYGAEPTPNTSQRWSVQPGRKLGLAHTFKANTEGVFADSWYRQDDNPWFLMQEYHGRVGTGVVVAEPDNLVRTLTGPYSGGDCGLVVYDNIAIYELDD